MADPTYKDFLQGLSPLQQPNGKAWNKATGDVIDNRIREAKDAVKARFPLVAPTDALLQLGKERQVDRLPSESDASYAARLQDAWTSWPWAGTAYGLLTALKTAGYPNVALHQVRGHGDTFFGSNRPVIHGSQLTLDASGNLVVTALPPQSPWIDYLRNAYSTWAPSTVYAGQKILPTSPGRPENGAPLANVGMDWYFSGFGTSGTLEPDWGRVVAGNAPLDGNIAWSGQPVDQKFWSRFVVYFFTPLPASWGTPPADSSDEATRIKRIITKWKPAHMTCAAIVIITAGVTWDYPGTGRTFDTEGLLNVSTQVTWTPP